MSLILKSKRILITAGPTWVPLDKVRVVTNIFGGSLGVEIAKACIKEGGKVTLMFGPGLAKLPTRTNNLEIIKYKYYNDLLQLVKSKIAKGRYDVMIHSAAVADYVPVKCSTGKIKSGKKRLIIQFRPTLKIIDLIKKIDPNIFLVKFKLEVGLSDDNMIDIAYKSMLKSEADLIIANEFSTVSKEHKAFIIDTNRNIIRAKGKSNIAKQLVLELANRLKKNKKL